MIKEIIEEDQPRERFITKGVSSLSDEELIAILIRTGIKNKNVKEVARDILLETKGINNLANYSYTNLASIPGVGKVKAITLLSALELGKRALKSNNKVIKIVTDKDIYNLFKYDFINEKQEKLIGVFLDNKNQIIASETIFIGTANQSMVHPREVFKLAVKYSAVKVIVVHNHPSGNPYPSCADDDFTRVLSESGKMLDIPLIDHIIIGKNSYYCYNLKQVIEES